MSMASDTRIVTPEQAMFHQIEKLPPTFLVRLNDVINKNFDCITESSSVPIDSIDGVTPDEFRKVIPAICEVYTKAGWKEVSFHPNSGSLIFKA
jgi:hypothetical protein